MLWYLRFAFFLSVPAFSNNIDLLLVLNRNAVSTKVEAAFHRLSKDALSEVLSIDDFIPAKKTLCFIGRPKEICKMVKRLNRNAQKLYDEGLHYNVQISECRVDRDLRMKIDFTHDWVREVSKKELDVLTCAVDLSEAEGD